ncbi:lipocalin-15-like [Limosa lapponica baueri]|uniref:Lipocalin-15-like n=1 Tax=Limosa lapponica baueri TaxID=1758121 RepID=A0A2I0T354_LIMLA|nr:lipocalin-15-like [Limosa lapponica baueri]
MRDLRVMETDYSGYAIVHEFKRSGQEPHSAMQLLTREQDVSPQLLQKFKELMPTVGLTKDMVAILPKSDQCTKDIRLTARSHCQIAGKWYIIAMASDSESYLRKKDELKMATATIVVLGEGDLKVSFAIPT